MNFLHDQTQNTINWYSCGPTVHADTHIGHARTFSIFDSLRKYYVHMGKIVNYGMNITDIDDKINVKVRYLNCFNILEKYVNQIDQIKYIKLLEYYNDKSNDNFNQLTRLYNLSDLEQIIMSIANDKTLLTPPNDLYHDFIVTNTNKFWTTLDKLNITRPTITISVSDIIPQIEQYIDKLVNKECAYVSNGSVYFDVDKYYSTFGHDILDHSNDNDLNVKDGFINDKRNSKDFALWKKSKDNSICFNSKYGNGTPGWHIECSVIASMMFEDNVDIHSGGIDLRYPHHSNENKQSCSYYDKNDVFKKFIYTGHVCIDNEKMAQSVGNYMTVDDYLKKHNANSMRLLFWMVPLGNPLNLTNDLINQAVLLDKRINELLSSMEFYSKNIKQKKFTKNVVELNMIIHTIEKYMYDDFVVNKVIESINNFITQYNKMVDDNIVMDVIYHDHLIKKIKQIFDIIGIIYDTETNMTEMKYVDAICEIRTLIRKNKLFELSDKIRDVIFPKLGWKMQDTVNGQKPSKL
mgnify:CR=1 FL=1